MRKRHGSCSLPGTVRMEVENPSFPDGNIVKFYVIILFHGRMWMVCGWYADGMWMVCGLYVDGMSRDDGGLGNDKRRVSFKAFRFHC